MLCIPSIFSVICLAGYVCCWIIITGYDCWYIVCSVANKSRLRYVVYLHLLLIALMLARLSVSLSYLFNTRPPLFLEELGLPPAWLWEYVWLCSAVPALFAIVALRKNRSMLLKQYMLGSVLFGLGPVFFGIVQLFGDLLNYWETRETKVKCKPR